MKPAYSLFFFFNDTATTEIYTLSLHDALPILLGEESRDDVRAVRDRDRPCGPDRDQDGNEDGALPQELGQVGDVVRSEEHTSELLSPCNLVCRLLLEKKKYYCIR